MDVGVALALLYAVLMGAASIFSRRGLESGSFRALLGISLAVGTLVFVPVAALTTGFADLPPVGVAYVAAGAVAGSVLSRSLYFLGIEYLGPGKSISISGTSPLYVAALAWVVLDETLTAFVVVGTLAVVVGILVLSRDVREQTERAGRTPRVALYPLGAAVLAGLAITLRKLGLDAGIAPIEAGTVNMVVGLAVVAPLLATRWRADIAALDRGSAGSFVVASTLMAVGFVALFVGLQRTDASVFFPLAQTQPLFAVLFSALFLRRLEVVTRWTLFGSAVIVGGAALVVLG